jgi:hypothetical protein
MLNDKRIEHVSSVGTRLAQKTFGADCDLIFDRFFSTFQAFAHEPCSYFCRYWPAGWIDIDILRTARRAGRITRSAASATAGNSWALQPAPASSSFSPSSDCAAKTKRASSKKPGTDYRHVRGARL